jgi:hypothetical protein
MVQVAVGASAEPPHTSSVELSRAIDSKTAAACSPAGAAYIRRPVKPDCPRGVGVCIRPASGNAGSTASNFCVQPW